MAFLASLLTAAASKAGVAAAGAVLTVTGVGTAAVTGNLPADIQTQVDELIGAERDDESGDTLETELVENEADNEIENDADAEADADADADGGNEVSEAATTAGEGLEGRERGEAISTAVREANGSADAGQAEERRAEAATRAEAGRANADGADDDAEAETDPAERRADAADEAATGQGRADTAEGDDDLEDEDEDGAEADDADGGRQDAQYRPEGAGAPDSEG
ncbi:MAG: hypothetical protein KY457_00715 [Actinobacteria bacterium]|nr:hypothetical protein [Actinomycetota bacterium]